MVMNKQLEMQLWASEFFLTERIPEHIMDPETSWDDFDIWIEEHIAEPFQDMAPSEIWDLIWELASYTRSTIGTKS